MRRVLFVLVFISITSSWVIYKRAHKRKLICKEESDWGNSTTVFHEVEEIATPSTRVARDIPVDPIHKQPIIFVGGGENETKFIDDGDFDIVSEFLTKDELAQVKKQIMDTCNALNAE